MKIDIGHEGKILGTKRVSPNGQVSGLSEYAGEEVLIIYPGPREPRIRMDAKDYMREVEEVVSQQMRQAFRQYRSLKARYKDEAAATRAFLKAKSPRGFQGLLESVDEWVTAQASKAERSVARRLGEPGQEDPRAGGPDHGMDDQTATSASMPAAGPVSKPDPAAAPKRARDVRRADPDA